MEVVLWRGTLNGTCTQCNLNIGGDLGFFTVECINGTAIRNIKVLSCRNGQYGGLGNALFSNAQSVPVCTKAVSRLLECTFTSTRCPDMLHLFFVFVLMTPCHATQSHGIKLHRVYSCTLLRDLYMSGLMRGTIWSPRVRYRHPRNPGALVGGLVLEMTAMCCPFCICLSRHHACLCGT